MDCSMPDSSTIPGICSYLYPLSQWCHLTVLYSATHFSFCLQSFPASGSFSVSWLFPSGGQSIGVSALASALPKNIQDGFPECYSWIKEILISFRIDRFDLLGAQETLKSLLQHPSLKASILWHSAFFMVQLSHPYMPTGKNHSFDYMDLCWQSDSFAF